jgi:hypothetical protein
MSKYEGSKIDQVSKWYLGIPMLEIDEGEI